jgi:hypothetical protein
VWTMSSSTAKRDAQPVSSRSRAEEATSTAESPVEATELLTRHQWRQGDMALLKAAAARLGMQVSEPARDD